MAAVALNTLRFLPFRVNPGAGQTEAMVCLSQGPKPGRLEVRFSVVTPAASCLALVTGDSLRLTPEYRYLGVIRTPRDTGHRDMESNAQRAQTAWAQARGLMTSPSLPWALRQAWMAGCLLPAAPLIVD